MDKYPQVQVLSVINYLKKFSGTEIVSVVNLNRPLKVQETLPEKTTATYRNLLAGDNATATPEGLSLALRRFRLFRG